MQKTIKQFMQVGATVGHAEHSGDLRRFIEQGKKIIVTTVQKFPWVLDEIGAVGDKRFAIVIDEAHSGQGGKTSAAMGKALGEGADATAGDDEERDAEDVVNAALEARMAARKMLTNASYFAFTATPKNKTLEMFGEPLPPDAEGKVKHQPFHHYSMKQAVQERFILDVLEELRAGRQLLQADQEDRGRPGVRHQEGEEEAAPLRGEPRPRDPAEGRDHGGPLPRAGAGRRQDRRAGQGDGGDQRHRARRPVLPRDARPTCRSARARTRPSSPSRASTSSAASR
ncbi:MAG: hypothetical protein V9G29_05750 [Burkholderiaceae bacterium]